MELKNLQSIFNNLIFLIPDYQRGYAWEDKQLNDLWRDISILGNERIHYTGLLSVDPQENKTVHIVDGQQRLASLIILIHAICRCEQWDDEQWANGFKKEDYIKRYLYRETGEEVLLMIFGYEKDNPSHIHFKTKILNMDDSEEVPEHTLYTNNLDTAKTFFENKIKGMKFPEIEILLKKVTEQLQFLYYPLDDKLNQFITFETLNYRGKSLTKLELLKNRLMYLSTELPKKTDEEKVALRKRINDAWKTIYEYLGKNPKNKLDDDNFLMAHWIIYFDKYDRSASNVFANFLLDEHFTHENLIKKIITYKEIGDYVSDIQRVVKSWYYLHNPQESKYQEKIKTWLGKLNRLNFRSFRPLVASILANDVDESKIVKVLEYAERFNFVVLELNISGRRRANYKAVPIYKISHKAHRYPEQFEPKNLSLNALDVPDTDFTFTRTEFVDAMQKREEGFYEWGGLPYFLYEYELHLQQEFKADVVKLQWEEVNRETVEHIYPQTPTTNAWPKFKSQKAKNCLHDLGNLLLISRATNSRLKNDCFKEKKKLYATGSYSAIYVSKNRDWTPKTIKDREEKMLDFLRERWKLKEPK